MRPFFQSVQKGAPRKGPPANLPTNRFEQLPTGFRSKLTASGKKTRQVLHSLFGRKKFQTISNNFELPCPFCSCFLGVKSKKTTTKNKDCYLLQNRKNPWIRRGRKGRGPNKLPTGFWQHSAAIKKIQARINIFNPGLNVFDIDPNIQSRSKFSTPVFLFVGPSRNWCTDKGAMENFNPQSIARHVQSRRLRPNVFNPQALWSGMSSQVTFRVAWLLVGALYFYHAHVGRTVLPKWPHWAHLSRRTKRGIHKRGIHENAKFPYLRANYTEVSKGSFQKSP